MPSPTYKHETGTVKDGGLTTNNKPLGPINCSGTNQEQVFNKPLGPINPSGQSRAGVVLWSGFCQP